MRATHVIAWVAGIWAALAIAHSMTSTRITVCPRSHESRVKQTRAELKELGFEIARNAKTNAHLPGSLDALRASIALEESDSFADSVLPTTDDWGNPYVYEPLSSSAFRITCYGADGKPGGEGEDADIVLDRSDT